MGPNVHLVCGTLGCYLCKSHTLEYFFSTKRMPTIPDVIENLPNGWKKLLRTRNSGASVGGKDVYIIDQRDGLRFRSTRTLAKHIQKHNLFATVDPNVVNFERPGEMKPKTRIHKDFIAWIDSKGTTNPKFLQRM